MDRIIPARRTSATAEKWIEERLAAAHARLADGQRMLVEYKPFEPAFYHTDIADWGMALLLARSGRSEGQGAGGYRTSLLRRRTSSRLWLGCWMPDMLGGFHFNDRRYADDDLTLGSIDPYQVFRIFHEIRFFEWETGQPADIAYMVDQSHNLKGKIEAMIQTVTSGARAVCQGRAGGSRTAQRCARPSARWWMPKRVLKDAYSTDVRPAIVEWAKSKGLPDNPMDAFRESGYLERITAERAEKNASSVSSYA